MRRRGPGGMMARMACGKHMTGTLLLLLLTGTALAGGYSFRIGDDEVEARLIHLVPGRGIEEGDLVDIDGRIVRIGPPGDYRFVAGPGSLTRVSGDGKRWPFWVEVMRGPNPLDGMSATEIAGLRGVDVCGSDEGVLASLAKLDLDRAVIVWRERGPGEAETALPALPAGTRHLVVDLMYNLRFGFSRVTDFSSLGRLTELRTLVSEGPGATFDLKWIAGARSLEVLDLTGQRVLSTELLPKFGKLRRLVLSMAAIGEIPGLENLKALRSLHASFSRLRRLPAVQLPSLREVHLAGSEVPDAVVEAFRRKNPECKVYRRWTRMLRDGLRGADRVRILDLEGGTVIADVPEREAVAELVGGIAFHEGRSMEPNNSGGAGGLVLQFMEGEAELGRIRLVTESYETAAPPRTLRLAWPEVFPGDGTLTHDSADRVAGLF